MKDTQVVEKRRQDIEDQLRELASDFGPFHKLTGLVIERIEGDEITAIDLVCVVPGDVGRAQGVATTFLRGRPGLFNEPFNERFRLYSLNPERPRSLASSWFVDSKGLQG